MVRYAHENFLVTQTWGEAMDAMRAKYCTGNQNPYSIVSGILDEAAEANSDLAPSPAQEELVTSLIAALSGQEAHWEVGIKAKINSTSAPIKQALEMKLLTAQTRGQVQASIDRFNAVFGRPANTSAGTPPVTPPADPDEVADEDAEEAF